MAGTKWVAHRGEYEVAPENTLEAFALAWARGAPAIEGDFRLTADDAVVCFHDDNLKRLCGNDRRVDAMTLDELRRVDVGVHRGPAWAFTRIPTLAEVLATLPPQGGIFIELKCHGPDFPRLLDRVGEIFATANRRPEQLSFIAFDEAGVALTKQRFPEHQVYWLLTNEDRSAADPDAPVFTPDGLVEKLRSLGVDGVDMMGRRVTPEHVAAVHAAGMSFHVWTIDKADEARRLIAAGVDSITSNRAYDLQHELAAGK